MTDGKHAVGLTGFPTPNAASTLAGYLLFLFEDKEYAQWLLGAVEPLVNAYNFYESGDLSPDEAAELFRQIVQDAPYNLKTCANPAGGKILHVATNGHVEELSDANTWQDPTGDYEIPPVPDRTTGTTAEQNCLAAKNAANVLQLLYENVTDSFNNDLDEAEAATALTLTLVGLIGSEFAPITFALVTFFAIVFSVLYGLLEFIGADLWDSTFTEALECILLGCASNDAGVVTFDYACFNDALAAQTTVAPLTFDQLRLFGQIQYLLLVIGGVDALNQAGATTAITDDDCSFCENEWCIFWDFTTDSSLDGLDEVYGSWVSGDGYTGVYLDTNSKSEVYLEAGSLGTVNFTHIEQTYSYSGSGANNRAGFQLYAGGVQVLSEVNGSQGSHVTKSWDGNITADYINFQLNSGTDATAAKLESMLVRGVGTPPTLGTECP